MYKQTDKIILHFGERTMHHISHKRGHKTPQAEIILERRGEIKHARINI